jgi:type II secretory pathway pseudopilin PulG
MIESEAPGEPSSTPPPARSRAWIGRAAFEAALIVMGLVGALLVDEWRDTRQRDARVRSALASIRAELEANRSAITQATANHELVIAELRKASETGIPYQRGIVSSPPFSSVAWEAARDGAITNDIDYAQLTSLGYAYDALAGYVSARGVFVNYLYTNRTVDFRKDPLALVGWLNDLRRHAGTVETQLEKALTAISIAGQGREDD